MTVLLPIVTMLHLMFLGLIYSKKLKVEPLVNKKKEKKREKETDEKENNSQIRNYCFCYQIFF